ncbi:hypothetical protein CTI14_11110 [Methylobacterium radiotolerans]|nr:hypothetical protein CTI14_11110 [Methylobacterium radiotolerans]
MTKNIKIFIDNITQPWGTERAVINLANNLSSHGYIVEIISSYSTSGKAAFATAPNITITHLSIPQIKTKSSSFATFINLCRMYSRFSRNLYNQNTILIGTNSVINSLLVLIRFMQRHKIGKVIGCEHLPYSFGTKFTFLLKRVSYRYLDHLVLLTERDALKYRKFGLTNLQVIPNEAPNIIPNLGKKRENIIISVGRLTDQKGFDLLIKEISPLMHKFEDWKVEIYGEGELRPLLSQMITDLRMENKIFLHGAVENIHDKYQNSSIYLMTSRYEGFAMVLLEAQANGLPIVAYDCDTGPSEIVHNGQNGYLIPMGHSDDFRKRVEELIKDSEKREAMGHEALRSVQQFGCERIFLKWQALVESGNVG